MHPSLAAAALVLALVGPKAAGAGDAPGPVDIEGHPYLSLSALAGMAGGSVERLPGTEKVRLRVGSGEIHLVPGSSIVISGRASVRLYDPVRWYHGAVYVPVRGFPALVERLAPGRVPVGTRTPPQGATLRGGAPASGQAAGAGPSPPSTARQHPPSTGVSPNHPKGGGEREPWLLHTVVIDPGHGGKDRGAIGPTGLEEKDVALKVALRLKALVEGDLKVRVVLTRSDDHSVSLGDRAKIALEEGGKLFVSLHCNSSPVQRRGTGGTEVYFLSEARTEEAREVARRENAEVGIEGKDAAAGKLSDPVLRDIFEGMSSDQYLKESQDLASDIRSAVARAGGGLKDRGVKQAGFYVMKGTQARMPSVLVEMAFISSPREERLLRREAFLEELARAVLDGIRAFKVRTEQAVGH